MTEDPAPRGDTPDGSDSPAWASFDSGVKRAFLVLVVLGGLAIWVGLATAGEVGPALAALSVVGALVITTAFAVIAFGVDHRRTWARSAAIIALLAAIPIGLLDLYNGFLADTVMVPIGVVIAIVLLRRLPGGTPLLLSHSRRAVVASGLVVAALAWPTITQALTTAGGPLAVTSDALELSSALTCPAATIGQPIALSVGWRWRARDILAGGIDGMGISLSALDGDAIENYSLVGDTMSNGVWRGGGGRSFAAVQAFTDPTFGALFPTGEYGIDVAAAGLADGRVTWTIERQPDAPTHGSLSVQALYAHLDRWERLSDPVECRW